nr:hypothetical protein [Pandoravirus aubagnensis]
MSLLPFPLTSPFAIVPFWRGHEQCVRPLPPPPSLPLLLACAHTRAPEILAGERGGRALPCNESDRMKEGKGHGKAVARLATATTREREREMDRAKKVSFFFLSKKKRTKEIGLQRAMCTRAREERKNKTTRTEREQRLM